MSDESLRDIRKQVFVDRLFVDRYPFVYPKIRSKERNARHVQGLSVRSCFDGKHWREPSFVRLAMTKILRRVRWYSSFAAWSRARTAPNAEMTVRTDENWREKLAFAHPFLRGRTRGTPRYNFLSVQSRAYSAY